MILTIGLSACGGGGGGGGDSGPVDPPIDPPIDPPFVPGLSERPQNTACIAPEKPVEASGVAVVDAFPDAPDFEFVTKIAQAPNNAQRWYVLEKSGRIIVFDNSNPANANVWLNFRPQVSGAGEGGLLGIAFDPDFPATPHVYISYTYGPNDNELDGSRISRLVLNNPDSALSGVQEQVLLEVDQPFNNHNAGDIAFGADGFLYFGLGDGGQGYDPSNNAQNTTTLLGSMLRIDVLGVPAGERYRIPAGNPFQGNPKCGPAANAQSCPEIYAWGLRNPWRWSFDNPTNKLWLGDVGQNDWEEVNQIVLGGNYGWDCREGFGDLKPNLHQNPDACTNPVGLIEPTLEYPHTNGNQAITGGYVYRGDAIPFLKGRYVFADYASGRIWALKNDGQGGFTKEELFDANFFISSFAVGADNELYLTSYPLPSRIYRLKPVVSGVDSIPDDLADTGCQDDSVLIPYTINAPFWSDGAVKSRYMGLPDRKFITVDGQDDWVFPIESVLVKSFELGGKKIETRLLMRHPDGDWAGYTYQWNDAGTAATRVKGGATRQVAGQTWIYPSEGECLQCHTAAAKFSLGPETAQLNGNYQYPSTGITSNQLLTLSEIGVFNPPAPANIDVEPRLADPFGSADLESRARAYLHTNCAQCHRPNGPVPPAVGMDFRYQTDFAGMNVCDRAPTQGDLGITNAALLAPGEPQRSVILNRMSRRDASGMPPTGSAIADDRGAALIEEWIRSLSDCR